VREVSVFLEHHWVAASLSGLALIIIGVLLSWNKRRSNVELRAQSRSVVVNGDNSGSIITGDIAGKQRESSSRDWIDVSGAIIAILGTMIAALAWLLPRAPQ
jgi:hypothetical protein